MIYPHQGEGSGGSDGRKAKIRGIETYGHETSQAVAGQRTAINLAAIGKDDISRGDVLAAKDAVTVTSMIDVSLKIFSSTDRIVLNNSRVHLYSGAAEHTAGDHKTPGDKRKHQLLYLETICQCDGACGVRVSLQSGGGGKDSDRRVSERCGNGYM